MQVIVAMLQRLESRAKILALVITICVITTSLSGQALVTGVILDSSGAGVQYVKITATNVKCVSTPNCGASAHVASTTTDVAGRYVLNLEPGRYLIQTVSESSGFIPFVRRVNINPGKAKRLDVHLRFGQPAFTLEHFKKWVELQIRNQLKNPTENCGVTSNLPKDKKRLEKTNRCVLRALAKHKAFTAEVGLMGVDSDETLILIYDGSGFARLTHTSYHYWNFDATVASQQPLVWEDCLDGLQPSVSNSHVLECKKPAPH